MGNDIRREIVSKARTIDRLTGVLKCEIDIVQKEANVGNIFKIRDALVEVSKTVRLLYHSVNELEYILKTERNKESQ